MINSTRFKKSLLNKNNKNNIPDIIELDNIKTKRLEKIKNTSNKIIQYKKINKTYDKKQRDNNAKLYLKERKVQTFKHIILNSIIKEKEINNNKKVVTNYNENDDNFIIPEKDEEVDDEIINEKYNIFNQSFEN